MTLQKESKPAANVLYEAAAVNARAMAAAVETGEAGLKKQYARRTLELVKATFREFVKSLEVGKETAR